ncbi:MAG: glycosyltransferase [Bacteriovoracia bacterium]
MKRISILTAVFENPVGLQTTVDSLLPLFEKTKAISLEVEYIVLDSSPELHQEIIKNLEAKVAENKKITLKHLRLPKNGIYAAFNEGIRSSTGDYIWFLNGGDKAGDIENLLRLFAVIGSSQNREPKLFFSATALYKRGQFQYVQWPSSNFMSNLIGSNKLCHQSVFYSRSCFDQNGVFRENLPLAADYEFHLRLAKAEVQATYVPEITSQYDMSGQSSNYKLAFQEFRRIQHEQKDSPSLSAMHAICYQFEKNRVRFYKALSKSFIGEPLSKLRLFLKKNTKQDLRGSH